MDLSIVIVNWNSAEFVRDCVSSIVETTHGLDYEIIVVDNASQPAACQELAAGNRRVKVICSERNIGFARANNLGLGQAAGERVLFLNPDTVVLGEAMVQMVTALDSSAEIGAVGCRLLNADGSLQTTSVQGFPTLTNQLFGMDWLQRKMPRLPIWGMRAMYTTDTTGPTEVEVVSGACLMARRSVLSEVSGFSTDYFMYGEEADLCRKIQQTGRKVCYTGQAEVVHFGGQSTKEKGSTFSDVVMRESVFLLLRKFKGAAYAYGYRGVMLLSAAARMLLLALLLPVASLTGWPMRRGHLMQALRKWTKIASWSLALEPWVHELGVAPTPAAGPVLDQRVS
jgi:GT2 family glycosyltransferase